MSLHNNTSLWPRPSYDENDEPHFLFILTPPYTGSTTMANYLSTSKNVAILRENGEGQRLVPGIHRNWHGNDDIDPESIKASWLNRYQEMNTRGQIEIIVEKSPPNMVRIDSLLALFKNSTCLVNNRNPVAFCSSSFFRNNPGHVDMSIQERRIKLQKNVNAWVKRSTVLMKLVQAHEYPKLSYEDFCESPVRLKELVETVSGITITPDSDTFLRIKDYPPSQIRNQNEKQISRFSETDIDIILKTLAPHRELINFFGYPSVLR